MNNVTKLSTLRRDIPMKWVESLFSKMLAFYGNKFLDMWRDAEMDDVKHQWAQEMSKLTNEELKRGVDSLVNRDWPPTLPEFVKLCKPSVDPTVAYYEAVYGLAEREKGKKGTWSHPAIFWAATKLSFEMRSQTYSSVKGRWEKALSDEMDKGEWAAIPEPMIALPAPGKTEMSKEYAAQMLQKLGSSGILKKSGDQKRWARRVLERVAAGEKMPEVSVRFAHEAMATV